jgi:hypothetical protein
MDATPGLMHDTHLKKRQTRRAWLALSISLLIFAILFGIAILLGNFYFRHATQTETASLSIVSGTGALIRSPGDDDWRLITGTTQIAEGDELSTTLGTVLWVTLFDGSTVEVAEDTVLTIERMRVSRFLNTAKHVLLKPERGTIYVAMAPRGEYDYSEFTVETTVGKVSMADGDGTASVGSFLVEVQALDPAAPEGLSEHWARAAVLRGAATLTSGSQLLRLGENQQVRVEESGEIGPITPAVRQLVSDGSFKFGLSHWVEYHDGRQGAEAPMSSGSVEFVNEWVNDKSVIAVEFLRGPRDHRPASTGIRQRIGQTLRVYSSVRLEFDLKISAQEPAGGGVDGVDMDQFPFVVELNYIDVMGEERQWRRHFYAIVDPDHPVPLEKGSRVDLNTWEHVIFELHNLSPLPRQITSLVLYASGQSYQTMVTNVSLTSSELGR